MLISDSAVVCREHSYQSKYADLKPDPVAICSRQCPQQVDCLVSEAARATSAASTFFPFQQIGQHYFVDGGLECNNPSYFIYEHCTKPHRSSLDSRASGYLEFALHPRGQGEPLRFEKIRFVNLGTGTKPKNVQIPKKRFAALLPSMVRMSIFIKTCLVDIAVESEKTAAFMRNLALTTRASASLNLEFDRLSADTGVCFIKMDDVKQLNTIEDLTHEYLEKAEVKRRLEKLAENLADDYLWKNGIDTIPTFGASYTS